MTDTKGTITYPVSTRYRDRWSDWEAVREIMQNAFDSHAEIDFNYDLKSKTLVIRDYGPGFELHHLLIGETTKDGERSIGKFGEGLKFGLLVLARMERKVTIQSNDLIIKARLAKMFDHQVLVIDWKRTEDHVSGTEVTIKGIPRSYRERFLSFDWKENFANQVLIDKPGQLFVKGIYVKDIDAVAGYNLNIERENPISGDVDSWQVQYHIASLIEQTNDPAYISTLLLEIINDPKGEKLEFVAGATKDWDGMNKDLWTSIASDLLGPKFCLSTDGELYQEMKREGYRVITTDAHFPRGFMKTDINVVRSRGSAEWQPVSKSELSPKMIDNLAKATYLVSHILGSFPLNIITVGKFVNDPHVYAMTRPGAYIRIAIKALNSLEDLILTLIEEVIHYKTGSRDLTPQHEIVYNQALAELIKFFMKDQTIVAPDYLAEELLNEDANA